MFAQLPAAIRHWSRTDPVLAALARRTPPVPWKGHGSSGFGRLVVSLIHQQVSLAAGRSITRKVVAACDGRITPDAVLRLGPGRLRRCGVSRQKQSYLLDLARRTRDGDLRFRSFSRLDDQAVITHLTQVKGIGVWTAKMFLLGHLGRPDVVAPEDLGLRLAVANAYRVPMARTAAFMERRRAAWSPYGSLACLTLWSHKDNAKKQSV